MYEVTVSTPVEQNYLLDHLLEQISPHISQIGGTFATLQQKNRSYFSLACSDTFRFQTQRILEDSVAQILAVGYKNVFVRRLLDLQSTNFHQNVLIDTMCVFDHQYDADIIANTLDSNKDIFVDGYYNFRIDKLKYKWEKVANMILENNYILDDNKLILEFLQYLLQSVDTKLSHLCVSFDKSSCILYDFDGKVLDKCKTLSPCYNAEVESVVNAICLAPQKVIVYHKDPLSKDFCDVIKGLFDVKFVEVQ